MHELPACVLTCMVDFVMLTCAQGDLQPIYLDSQDDGHPDGTKITRNGSRGGPVTADPTTTVQRFKVAS